MGVVDLDLKGAALTRHASLNKKLLGSSQIPSVVIQFPLLLIWPSYVALQHQKHKSA